MEAVTPEKNNVTEKHVKLYKNIDQVPLELPAELNIKRYQDPPFKNFLERLCQHRSVLFYDVHSFKSEKKSFELSDHKVIVIKEKDKSLWCDMQSSTNTTVVVIPNVKKNCVTDPSVFFLDSLSIMNMKQASFKFRYENNTCNWELTSPLFLKLCQEMEKFYSGNKKDKTVCLDDVENSEKKS